MKRKCLINQRNETRMSKTAIIICIFEIRLIDPKLDSILVPCDIRRPEGVFFLQIISSDFISSNHSFLKAITRRNMQKIAEIWH